MQTGNQIAVSLQADIGLRPDIRYIPGGSIDYAHYDRVARCHRAAGFAAAGRALKAFASRMSRLVVLGKTGVSPVDANVQRAGPGGFDRLTMAVDAELPKAA